MENTTNNTLAVNLAWCKGCGICAAFCPQGVLELAKQKVFVAKPEKCVACGLCEMCCPDYAVWLEEEKNDD